MLSCLLGIVSVSRVCKHSDFFEYADADFDGYKTYLSENVLYELTKCLQPCHYTDFPMERAKYTADHVNEVRTIGT